MNGNRILPVVYAGHCPRCGNELIREDYAYDYCLVCGYTDYTRSGVWIDKAKEEGIFECLRNNKIIQLSFTTSGLKASLQNYEKL